AQGAATADPRRRDLFPGYPFRTVHPRRPQPGGGATYHRGHRPPVVDPYPCRADCAVGVGRRARSGRAPGGVGRWWGLCAGVGAGGGGRAGHAPGAIGGWWGLCTVVGGAAARGGWRERWGGSVTGLKARSPRGGAALTLGWSSTSSTAV